MNMQTKGVAIPYIIAIIFGVVVLAIIGYWFFVMGGKFGMTTTSTECSTMKVSYCQESYSLGWSDTLIAKWDNNCGANPATGATEVIKKSERCDYCSANVLSGITCA